MINSVKEVKSAASAELKLLRADLENAVAAHKWFLTGGFVLGFIIGAWLTHVL